MGSVKMMELYLLCLKIERLFQHFIVYFTNDLFIH